MKTTEKLLAAAIAAVAAVAPEISGIWFNRQCLFFRANQARENIVAQFAFSQNTNALDPLAGAPLCSLSFQGMSTLNFAEAYLCYHVVNDSPEYQAAALIMDPMMAEVARLQELLESKQTARGHAAIKLQEAEQAATAAALAKSTGAPSVLAARKALAEIEGAA